MTQRRNSNDTFEILQEDILDSIESALTRLNEFTHRQIPTLNAPGPSLGLTHRDQILHVCAYGLANQEARQPSPPKTFFQVSSRRKSLISIVLPQAQELGLRSFDERHSDVVIGGNAMQAILSGGVYSRTLTP